MAKTRILQSMDSPRNHFHCPARYGVELNFIRNRLHLLLLLLEFQDSFQTAI